MTDPNRMPESPQPESPERGIDPYRETDQDPGKIERDRDRFTNPRRELPGDGEPGDGLDDGRTNNPLEDPEREFDQN